MSLPKDMQEKKARAMAEAMAFYAAGKKEEVPALEEQPAEKAQPLPSLDVQTKGSPLADQYEWELPAHDWSGAHGDLGASLTVAAPLEGAPTVLAPSAVPPAFGGGGSGENPPPAFEGGDNDGVAPAPFPDFEVDDNGGVAPAPFPAFEGDNGGVVPAPFPAFEKGTAQSAPGVEDGGIAPAPFPAFEGDNGGVVPAPFPAFEGGSGSEGAPAPFPAFEGDNGGVAPAPFPAFEGNGQSVPEVEGGGVATEPFPAFEGYNGGIAPAPFPAFEGGSGSEGAPAPFPAFDGGNGQPIPGVEGGGVAPAPPSSGRERKAAAAKEKGPYGEQYFQEEEGSILPASTAKADGNSKQKAKETVKVAPPFPTYETISTLPPRGEDVKAAPQWQDTEGYAEQYYQDERTVEEFSTGHTTEQKLRPEARPKVGAKAHKPQQKTGQPQKGKKQNSVRYGNLPHKERWQKAPANGGCGSIGDEALLWLLLMNILEEERDNQDLITALMYLLMQ